jgi:spore coat protein U-like protein
MSRWLQRLLACALLSLAAPLAFAYKCTLSLTDILVIYDPTFAAQNVTAGTYTISCDLEPGDTPPMGYRLTVNNGLNFGGGSNRVLRTGTQRYSYETYQDVGGATVWGSTPGSRINGALNFTTTTATASAPFYIILPGSQAVQPAGTYSDALQASLTTIAGVPLVTNLPFNVTVRTDNWCQIQVTPGPVAFTYTSFQPGTAAASTAYGIRCTTALPYTMALDATSGSLLGLTYNLALSSAASVGTGLTQNFNINGTIAGGQAGTCASASCTGSQTRTLLLSW